MPWVLYDQNPFLFSDKNFFNLAFDYVIFVEVSDSHKIELFLFSILLFSKKKIHNLERFKSDLSNEVPVLNWTTVKLGYNEQLGTGQICSL